MAHPNLTAFCAYCGYEIVGDSDLHVCRDTKAELDSALERIAELERQREAALRLADEWEQKFTEALAYGDAVGPIAYAHRNASLKLRAALTDSTGGSAEPKASPRHPDSDSSAQPLVDPLPSLVEAVLARVAEAALRSACNLKRHADQGEPVSVGAELAALADELSRRE